MPKLTPAQLAWYVTAGVLKDGVYGMQGMPITAHNAQIAVAVALAESGGENKRSDVANHDGSYDWGPWQLNDKAHQLSELAKTNVGANWATAYQISDRGTNWQPWTTYNSGAYLAFMAQAAVAIKSPDGSYQDKNEIPNTPASAAMSVLPAGLTSASTWIRVGMGVGGVLLLALVMAAVVGPHAMKLNPVTSALESAHSAVFKGK